MTDNQQIQSNAAPNSSIGTLDSVEEGIWRMKIENGDVNGEEKGGGDTSPLYPDRPGEPDCIFYLRTGLCGYGSKCRFNHPVHPAESVQNKGEPPQRDGQPDCEFYLETGMCKFGSSCRFHHPSDRGIAEQVPLNTMGLPIRQDAKSCSYYMRNYTCKFGATCKFNHPQLASAETVLPGPGPGPGPSAFGAAVTSVFPSVTMPYADGLSAWLIPRSPYLSAPRVPGPQTYASISLPPSQTIVSAQSWNTYMGTVPLTNIYGTNFYTSMDQGHGTRHLPVLSANNSGLPERPDQPECRHFMSTGCCKYGSDCKYHHPKERIAQLPIYGLGPHGLPLRPGEAMCSSFHMYGVCNYGSTCRFDHPIAGYVPSYSFSLLPLSLPLRPQPLASHQRISSINHHSESSPSKSSKISNWIQKPEPVEKDNEHPDANSSEDTKEPLDGRPQIPTTSKSLQDQ